MNNHKMKVTRLKKEIEVKDFIIKELIVFITNSKIKLPDALVRNIKILYTGESK